MSLLGALVRAAGSGCHAAVAHVCIASVLTEYRSAHVLTGESARRAGAQSSDCVQRFQGDSRSCSTVVCIPQVQDRVRSIIADLGKSFAFLVFNRF